MEELEELKKWPYGKELKVPIRIVLTGKTNTGKSYYARWLLYLLCDDIDELYVFCPTMKPKDWEDVTTKKHIFEEYNPNVIEDIIENQRKNIDASKPVKQIMIYLDDCIFSFKKDDKVLSSLFVKGRHYGISVMVISQKFRLLNNSIRSNADIIVVTKVINQQEKDALYVEYNGGGHKNKFYSLLDTAIKSKGVMIIDNVNEDEEVFWKDKAPQNLPKFYIEDAAGRTHRRDTKKIEDDGEKSTDQGI